MLKTMKWSRNVFLSTLNRFLLTRVAVAVQNCNKSIFMVDFEQVFVQKVSPIIVGNMAKGPISKRR